MTAGKFDDEPSAFDGALRAANDTRLLEIRPQARTVAAAMFHSAFGGNEAMIVADERTFAAAGQFLQDDFRRHGMLCDDPFLFPADVYAEYSFVERLHEAARARGKLLIAVGAGTINDLTKLVSHQLGKPYMVVATAASMDGYTAYGASITYRGSKQTFDCPAPRAVLADLDIIAEAPA